MKQSKAKSARRKARSAPPHGSALDCGMPNTTAYRLGLIASEVGTLDASKAGDEIDLGLILVRRLKGAGYSVVPNEKMKHVE